VLLASALLASAVSTLAAPEGTSPVAVVRGPYLQRTTPTSIVVRWRTDTPTQSQVGYGPAPSNLNSNVQDGGSVTEHELTIDGLSPNTRYYYSVGTFTEVLAGADEEHHFETNPPVGTPERTRIWVLGDSGTANANAMAVRDAYANFSAGAHTDLWLMLGDNAYPNGTDQEYQDALFDIYPEMLRTTALWPTIGNHDGVSSSSSTQTGPYFDMFTLPSAGQAGGMSSGTEAYYSFDYGDLHFVALDSQGSDRSPGSPMLTWLETDLAATDGSWIIAFWHHPPYSKGIHDSDDPINDFELVEMRQNVVPILDAYGVDLTLTGHSHDYERSYLIEGHYGDSSTFLESMKVVPGDGRTTGDGAYTKAMLAPLPNSGIVHTVAGSAGQISGGTLDHPAMFVSLNVLGSVVLDVDGRRLDLQFLDSTGVVRDSFTILKGPDCPDDYDRDGLCAAQDNCPNDFNPSQQDTDGDHVGNACDTCPTDPIDLDGDGLCSTTDCDDTRVSCTTDCVTNFDADTIPDCADTCIDRDRDGYGFAGGAGDTCAGGDCNDLSALCTLDCSDVDADGWCADADNCPLVLNPAQENRDGDPFGDVCDSCEADPRNDYDGDGWCDSFDNCPDDPNTVQTDTDQDAAGDACDCATTSPGVSRAPAPVGSTLRLSKVGPTSLRWQRGPQAHSFHVYRADRDSGQAFSLANLGCLRANVPAPSALDSSNPAAGAMFMYLITSVNVCGESSAGTASNGTGHLVPDPCAVDDADEDLDGVPNVSDNCPLQANPGLADLDHDFVGSACDNCFAVRNALQSDTDDDGLGDACEGPDADGDGVPDPIDNCPIQANSSQLDTDHDAAGNVCDACLNDADNDQDGDGVCGDIDNCPATSNLGQADRDSDGRGDVCDNCPEDWNANQSDADVDGVGDACAWWNLSWQNRKKITFDSTEATADLIDFPVLVTVDSASIQVIGDGSDLRFIDPADPTVELAYEIDTWVSSGTCTVWVKIPRIAAGTDTDYVWMYYNDPAAPPNPRPAAEVWDPGHAAVWHLGENSGSAMDSTSNANHGTFVGDLPSPAPGRVGKAQVLDGVDDFFVVPDSSSLSPTTAVTIEMWVQPSGSSHPRWALLYSDWDQQATSIHHAIYEGKVSLYISSDGTDLVGANEHLDGNTALTLAAWNHVAVSFDSGAFHVYLNGVPDATEYVSATDTTIFDSPYDKTVGIKNVPEHHVPFAGMIDEARISSVARSADWIRAQYRCQTGSFVSFSCEQDQGMQGCPGAVPQLSAPGARARAASSAR